MYRHVSLQWIETDSGQTDCILLGPNGLPIRAASLFFASLKNYALNTRKSYLHNLSEFIDYLIEVSIKTKDGDILTGLELKEYIESYSDYLRNGINSSHPTIALVAKSLNISINSPGTISTKLGSLRKFLEISEIFQQELKETGDFKSEFISDAPLFEEINKKTKINFFERQAMLTRSMIAGVISGGPKYKKLLFLKNRSTPCTYNPDRAFPYEKAVAFIESAKSYRDKCFYSLLAASGCRSHEALQILYPMDLDLSKKEIYLVDPFARTNIYSHQNLNQKEMEKLSWKGRSTNMTFLIEPFSSMFFQYLEKYLSYEYLPHGKHDFLFQYSRGELKGKPYFLSASSSRIGIFNKLCKKNSIELPKDTGAHSFRHMYGTYLLNYFPRSNGEYGLPLAIVQQMMGHAKDITTMRYARHDHDLIKLEINGAYNQILIGHDKKSIYDIKIEALEKQIEKLKLLKDSPEKNNE